jgi:hypothetical protein
MSRAIDSSSRLVHGSLVFFAVTLAAIAAIPLESKPGDKPRILDLRQEPREGLKVAPVPGYGMGSTSRGPYRAETYFLPLKLSIQSLKLNGTAQLEVQLLVINSGTSDYYLPVSRDVGGVQVPGNKGRRTFLISADISEPTGGELLSPITAVTAASTSSPTSTWRIGPGQSVIVVFNVSLRELRREEELAKLQLAISCSEWRLEDSRFFIKQKSEVVRSQPVSLNLIGN